MKAADVQAIAKEEAQHLQAKGNPTVCQRNFPLELTTAACPPQLALSASLAPRRPIPMPFTEILDAT